MSTDAARWLFVALMVVVSVCVSLLAWDQLYDRRPCVRSHVEHVPLMMLPMSVGKTIVLVPLQAHDSVVCDQWGSR